MFTRLFNLDIDKIKEALIFSPIVHLSLGKELEMSDIADLTRQLGQPCWRTCLDGVDMNDLDQWKEEIGSKFGNPPNTHEFVTEFDSQSDWDRAQNQYTKHWHQDYTATEKPVKFCLLYAKAVDTYDAPPTEFIDLFDAYRISEHQNLKMQLLHKVFDPSGEDIDNILHTEAYEGAYYHPVVQEWFGRKHFSYNPPLNQECKNWAEFSTSVFKEVYENRNTLKHTHHWKNGDIVIWNHTATLHRAIIPETYTGKRIMYRSNFDDNLIKEYYSDNVKHILPE